MRRINERLFWSRVRRLDHCWFWTGPVNHGGYGVHGTVLAHRASWRDFLWKHELLILVAA